MPITNILNLNIQLRKRKKTAQFYIIKIFLIVIGAIITNIGLQMFLIPNSVIDGGIVGISIMSNSLTGIPFGIIMPIISLPFIVYGWHRLGKAFAIYTLFAIIMLSVFSGIFTKFDSITQDPFLAAIFGGLIDGIGVGLIIKAGGSLDGTEIIAIDMDNRSVFSTGEVLMFINLFILSGAGFIFGWDKAMYSLFAYFIISKTIDVVIKGMNESYSVMIITDNADELKPVLIKQMGRGVTVLYGEGGYSGEEKKVLYCIVSRLEIDKLKDAVADVDENAFLTITQVNDIIGGRFKKHH